MTDFSETPPKFMSIKDTSKYLGLTTSYLRSGIRKGIIPHTMVGNCYMIDVESLKIQLEKTVSENTIIDIDEEMNRIAEIKRFLRSHHITYTMIADKAGYAPQTITYWLNSPLRDECKDIIKQSLYKIMRDRKTDLDIEYLFLSPFSVR